MVSSPVGWSSTASSTRRCSSLAGSAFGRPAAARPALLADKPVHPAASSTDALVVLVLVLVVLVVRRRTGDRLHSGELDGAQDVGSVADRKASVGDEPVAAQTKPGFARTREGLPPGCPGAPQPQPCTAIRPAGGTRSATTTSDSAAMMRLRAGNTPGRGSVPSGCSLTTAPCSPTAVQRADWFRGIRDVEPGTHHGHGLADPIVADARPRCERHRRCPWPARTQR